MLLRIFDEEVESTSFNRVFRRSPRHIPFSTGLVGGFGDEAIDVINVYGEFETEVVPLFFSPLFGFFEFLWGFGILYTLGEIALYFFGEFQAKGRWNLNHRRQASFSGFLVHFCIFDEQIGYALGQG